MDAFFFHVNQYQFVIKVIVSVLGLYYLYLQLPLLRLC